MIGFCLADGNLTDLNNSLSKKENLFNSDAKEILDANLNDLNLSNNTNILKEKRDFSFFSLYENADIVVKIVIYILVLFSVLTWGIFIAKILQYKSLNQELSKSLNLLKDTNTINDLPNFSQKDIAFTLSSIIRDEISKSKSTQNLNERINLRLQTVSQNIISKAKKFTGILASIGSSAPFIGLFGTVWGIMNSFMGIATSNNTGLDVVAPGIAEALFATAFGLVAAIPAVLFYNYTIYLNSKFTDLLDEVATMFFVIFDRTMDGNK
ncbi:MotA/TolQ/ExbB proton channel family protein [Campylobacter sp. FMV-PI01]|uniref:MotA/TolQ/ExbB proton channel family protein n=2 Tax=Campylobacter portucalensis TaxID=2608384 RepID=A0A6L5WMG9_9BACT|nr:MotA/TolQ/ExbB proton channel family protein [Campylobacter portucalensis]